MLKKILGMGAAAVTALVSACEGAPTTQQVYRRHEDIMSLIQQSTVDGPMLVQVYGNPFVSSQTYLDDIIAQELESSVTSLRNFKLTTDPALSASGNARLIVVMGAQKNQTAEALCENEPVETNSDDPIRAVAVFCIKDTLYSEVRGSIKASASPDGTSFRKWLGQIGRDLMLTASLSFPLWPGF